MQHRVTMKKGAAPSILAANTQLKALFKQGRICQRFGKTPIHAQRAFSHLGAIFIDLSDARMQRQIFRQGIQRLRKFD